MRRRLLVALAALVLVATAAFLLRPYPRAALAPGLGGSLVITDRRGEVLRVLPTAGGGRSRWVPLSEVAPLVLLATLAGEDHRFFDHAGVDPRALVRAGWLLATRGQVVSGASTLSMQLGRTLEPRPRRSLLSKLHEMQVALRLERTLDKRALLEQYLNRVYYGAGAHGIEAAAQRFFGRPAAALSDAEATLLAVLPRAPRAYDLRTPAGRAAALGRRGHVLGAMVRLGYLTDVQRQRLEGEPLAFAAAPPAPLQHAPHFVDWVLASSPPDERAAGELRTTLDLRLQLRLEALVRGTGPDAPAQVGLVVIDPTSGAVRAMVGSREHAGAGGQANITTIARHPGSALKPFVYALALESGASPASIVEDTRAALPGYHPGPRVRERGPARYREALAGSYNLAALGVLNDVGVAPLLERLRAAGLGPLPGGVDDYGLGLALGAGRVRLVDLTAAYGAFVNGGEVFAAHGRAGRARPVALFSPATSWLVLDMLADPGARRRVFGAELPLDLPPSVAPRVAAKTGTSAGFADTVAVAATREALVGAWAGAFDGSGTKGQLAMWTAAPLVRAALLVVAELGGAPLTLPPPPAGLVAHDVCAVSGRLPADDCPRKREFFGASLPGLSLCAGHARAASPGHPARSAASTADRAPD